jgi:hypothetical protein
MRHHARAHGADLTYVASYLTAGLGGHSQVTRIDKLDVVLVFLQPIRKRANWIGGTLPRCGKLGLWMSLLGGLLIGFRLGLGAGGALDFCLAAVAITQPVLLLSAASLVWNSWDRCCGCAAGSGWGGGSVANNIPDSRRTPPTAKLTSPVLIRFVIFVLKGLQN